MGKRAILIVDHGSRRARANEMLRCIERLVGYLAPSQIVRCAHMELASPTVDEGMDACVAAGAEHVTIVPYMLSPGRHATEDIPRLAAAAARRHGGLSFCVTAPLGVDPLLGRLVLKRAGLPEERVVERQAAADDCKGESERCTQVWCGSKPLEP